MKGAVGALAGSVALGMAGRAAVKRMRQPRVLGRVPRELIPNNFDPGKMAKNLDLKKVAKQVGSFAEQVEARSEDVRELSSQAKKLSKRLS